MPPRTRPRRSSGCSTRRRDRRRSNGRPPVAGPELQPAQGVGDSDGARVVVGGRSGHGVVERFPAIRPGQRGPAAQGRQVRTDQLDLAIERRRRPALRLAGRVVEPSQEAESIQRQHPGGCRRWSRSEGVARGEERPGRRRKHADRWSVAGTRCADRWRGQRAVGPGLASDDRHVHRLAPPCERRLIGRSTLPAGGRRSPRRGPCAGTADGRGPPRSGCAASGRGHRPCATRPRSRSPRRAPRAGPG
jgi:hypothetical protein